MTYWNNNGLHQSTYETLYGALVPDNGACDTLEGEILRAISKVYYDFYNNGFGNDMRGPVAFLREHFPVEGFTDIINMLVAAAPEGSPMSVSEERLEDLVNGVVVYIASKDGKYHDLEGGDMWTYRNRIDPYEDEDDGDDFFDVFEDDEDED